LRYDSGGRLMSRTRFVSRLQGDLRRLKFTLSAIARSSYTNILLHFDYVAIEIRDVSVWKLPAVLAA
jgi:hypothetical protein